jgi:FixJ family two-component response regulator
MAVDLAAPAAPSSSPDAAAAACDSQLAFVIDDDVRICQFVAKTIAELGIKAENFQTAKTALAALDGHRPFVVFLDVALLQSDAYDVLRGLGVRHFRGMVHLMSGANPSLLQAMLRLGARHGVTLGEPLSKPVSREAIVGVIAALRSTSAPDGPDGATTQSSPAVAGE